MEHTHTKRKRWGEVSSLSFKQKEWAYDMWCLGYTQMQIADALFVCEKTVQRALKNKPRIRPILIYKGGD